MAYIDAENTLMNSVTVASAATGVAVDLGSKGPFLSPLYVDVKLTQKLTSGSMDSFKIQSSADADFTSPQDEVEVTVPASVPQTSKPCTLAQFHSPIKPGNRYIRLVGKGTNPVGGKITATMQNGIGVDM